MLGTCVADAQMNWALVIGTGGILCQNISKSIFNPDLWDTRIIFQYGRKKVFLI